MTSTQGLRYGGDWNPEQWDEATIAEDIRLMGQAQVNLVTLGVFSWALTEPEEGRYDFDWLIRIMDRCAEAGIDVDLATGTASPPAWMAVNHPETLPVDRDGRTLGFGSRQQYSPANPYVRGKMVDLARALADAVKGHPALAMWHVGNEYGCHVAESFDPESIRQFRLWLAEKYQTVDQLNDAWGTAFWSQCYASFDQVGAPGVMPAFHNPGHVADWRQFFSDQMLACYLAEVDALREITPDLPITTNFMGVFPFADYWQWARHVDVVADDSYPEPAAPFGAHEDALGGDLMRSLGGNRPYILMEQTTEAVQWRQYNASKRPGQYRLWSLSRVGHGADGILQFQWRQSKAGSETFHSAMVPHAGTDTPVWRDVCDMGDDLAKLGGVAGEVPTNRIGIVIDWQAQWAGEALIARAPLDHFAQVRRWHRTFWEAGFGVDFVPVDGDFAAYDVIVLPSLAALPGDGQEFAARVRRAAESGTQVVVAGPTGLVDGRLHAFLGGYAGPLAEVAGLTVYGHACTAPQLTEPWLDEPVRPRLDRLSGAVSTPASGDDIEMTIKPSSPLAEVAHAAGLGEAWCQGSTWMELVRTTCDDVEVLARYADRGAGADQAGLPAIMRRTFPVVEGRPAGGIWWVGTQLEAPARAGMAALTAVTARVNPTGGQMFPAGIECIARGQWLFFLNHSEREVTLPAILAGREVVVGTAADAVASPDSADSSGAHARAEGDALVLPPRTGAVTRPR